MTVRELIDVLSRFDQNAILVAPVSRDANAYSPIDGCVRFGRYESNNRWFGEFTEGPGGDGVTAVLIPVYLTE